MTTRPEREDFIGIARVVDATRRRVLVADAEPGAAERLLDLIHQHVDGVDVRAATTSTRALALLHAHRVDLVITDEHLADASGLAFLRAARRVDARVPCILTSSTPDVSLALHAIREVGIVDYFLKPFDAGHVLHGVRDALDASARDVRARA